MGISLRKVVKGLLAGGVDPNVILKAVTETIEEHRGWVKGEDGQYHRSEKYDEFLKTTNPIMRMNIGEKNGKGNL